MTYGRQFHPRRMAASAAAAIAIIGLAGVYRPAPSAAQDLDMNAIMPCAAPAHTGKQSADACGAARDLLMQQCTSCHSFVPIVRLQKDEEGWNGTMTRHRERVADMSDDDYGAVLQFLKDHFRPDRPVPKLPQALIDNDPGFPPA